LIGPAFTGMILFVVGKHPKTNKIVLSIIGLGLLLSVLLLIRNMFGIVFVSTVGVIALAVGIFAKPRMAQLFSYFIAVQLSLSVFSRGDYLFMEYAETEQGRMPSDVANMANALFLPYWVWGIICGSLSIVFLLVGVGIVFRQEKKSQ